MTKPELIEQLNEVTVYDVEKTILAFIDGQKRRSRPEEMERFYFTLNRLLPSEPPAEEPHTPEPKGEV